MARDATARLYDVDEQRLEFKRLTFDKEKYDHGEIHFQAKKGKLVEIDKLRESIWATRLSGGTRSGVISLVVNVKGKVIVEQKESRLQATGSKRHFVLASDPDVEITAGATTPYDKMLKAIDQGKKVTQVTGRIDGWVGRWPRVLAKEHPKSPRLLVMSFETSKP